MATEKDNVFITVGWCSKCGESHLNLRFRKTIIVQPGESDKAEWVALCPKTGEPLTIKSL